MRTLCDVCESGPAVLFCAADEAALCSACDVKVHMCNKLANRHVRVGLAEPSEVQRCDICENEPAFFYCEVDGTSLCLQCDMIVHVGGKRTHGRYLMLRQRVEFPGDKPVSLRDPVLDRGNLVVTNMQPARASSFRTKEAHLERHVSFGPDTVNNNNMENNLIDLNARPQRMHGEAPHNREHANAMFDNNHESEGVVPD